MDNGVGHDDHATRSHRGHQYAGVARSPGRSACARSRSCNVGAHVRARGVLETVHPLERVVAQDVELALVPSC